MKKSNVGAKIAIIGQTAKRRNVENGPIHTF